VTFYSKYFEDLDFYHTGAIDSSGVIHAGTVGSLAIQVTALVAGAAPKRTTVTARIVPGPAVRVRVDGAVPRLLVGDQVALTARSLSAAGDARADAIEWRSSSPRTVRVDSTGHAVAIAPGLAAITARAGGRDTVVRIEVIPDDVASVAITASSAAARQGDVVHFTANVRDRRGRPIAGLTPRWTLTGGQGLIGEDGAFVAYDVGTYTVSSIIGSHVATTTLRVGARDVRRPPVVLGRIGHAPLRSSEVWVHPGGRYAYQGTTGDRLYAIDIHDPAHPGVTDSVMVDARIVNDLRTTPDGRFLVFTREMSSTRKDGIAIASLEDPAHPKVVAEFTDGVTSGVHSIFIDRQEKFGTHLYLTNDGTGEIDVVDITDPVHPRRVGSWTVPRATEAGRVVHDIEIKDGLLYASYWNEGLIVLDIGDGRKGGTPSSPQLVTQIKYDLDSLYHDAISIFGPDYIRGTHTAWPHGNYIFVADEVFTNGHIAGAPAIASFRTFSRLHVFDVSDLAHPKDVAWYEPEFGGVHNLWVAGDTLYMGAYEGGFRAFDISGELRGDLRAQQREIAHLHPAAKDGAVPNAVFTWGVVVRDGVAYVTDMFSGLWIVRLGAPQSSLHP
jgi:hypothetical protein